MKRDLIRQLEQSIRQSAEEQWNRAVDDAVLYGIWDNGDGTRIIDVDFSIDDTRFTYDGTQDDHCDQHQERA